MTDLGPPPVAESAVELAARFRRQPDQVFAYLDLLEERVDAWQPRVRALVDGDLRSGRAAGARETRFEHARRQVEALLARSPEDAAPDDDSLPLFGVPVAVKDVFHADGFVTRAGSAVPADELWPLDARTGLPASPEASSVTALRRAGALVLAKAECTELAYFGPGPTRNPHALEHTPGGSSSGSAAAVGAGLAPLAVGTQTIGSIGRPASYCGVVGYKPSHGRVPTDGVIPLAPVADHVGWFAADVASIAAVARASIVDWHDSPAARDPVPDAVWDAAPGARPARLGVPVGPYLERAEPAARARFEQIVSQCEARGWQVERVEVMTDFDEIEERHRVLVAADAWRAHRQRFERHGHSFHPKTRELLERGRAASESSVRAAQASQGALRRHLEQAMDAAELDAWLAPSAPGPAPAGLDSTGNPVMNLPFTHAGLPALTLPAGRIPARGVAAGLPWGLQVIARHGADESLLAWAADTWPGRGLDLFEGDSP